MTKDPISTLDLLEELAQAEDRHKRLMAGLVALGSASGIPLRRLMAATGLSYRAVKALVDETDSVAKSEAAVFLLRRSAESMSDEEE